MVANAICSLTLILSVQRQIVNTDSEIDHLVYELYGLTAEEVNIVEGETSTHV
jgi:hypothetical protein